MSEWRWRAHQLLEIHGTRTALQVYTAVGLALATSVLVIAILILGWR